MNQIPDSCPIPPDMADLGRLRTALDKLPKLQGKGTDGRVYGGDPDLIHIADGQRATMGQQMATMLDMSIRIAAMERGAITEQEMMDNPICPGCYMVALYDAAVIMARENGQSIRELARSMANAFARLAANPEIGTMEEIDVITDEAEAANPAIAGFILPHMESL